MEPDDTRNKDSLLEQLRWLTMPFQESNRWWLEASFCDDQQPRLRVCKLPLEKLPILVPGASYKGVLPVPGQALGEETMLPVPNEATATISRAWDVIPASLYRLQSRSNLAQPVLVIDGESRIVIPLLECFRFFVGINSCLATLMVEPAALNRVVVCREIQDQTLCLTLSETVSSWRFSERLIGHIARLLYEKDLAAFANNLRHNMVSVPGAPTELPLPKTTGWKVRCVSDERTVLVLEILEATPAPRQLPFISIDCRLETGERVKIRRRANIPTVDTDLAERIDDELAADRANEPGRVVAGRRGAYDDSGLVLITNGYVQSESRHQPKEPSDKTSEALKSSGSSEREPSKFAVGPSGQKGGSPKAFFDNTGVEKFLTNPPPGFEVFAQVVELLHQDRRVDLLSIISIEVDDLPGQFPLALSTGSRRKFVVAKFSKGHRDAWVVEFGRASGHQIGTLLVCPILGNVNNVQAFVKVAMQDAAANSGQWPREPLLEGAEKAGLLVCFLKHLTTDNALSWCCRMKSRLVGLMRQAVMAGQQLRDPQPPGRQIQLPI